MNCILPDRIFILTIFFLGVQLQAFAAKTAQPTQISPLAKTRMTAETIATVEKLFPKKQTSPDEYNSAWGRKQFDRIRKNFTPDLTRKIERFLKLESQNAKIPRRQNWWWNHDSTHHTLQPLTRRFRQPDQMLISPIIIQENHIQIRVKDIFLKNNKSNHEKITNTILLNLVPIHNQWKITNIFYEGYQNNKYPNGVLLTHVFSQHMQRLNRLDKFKKQEQMLNKKPSLIQRAINGLLNRPPKITLKTPKSWKKSLRHAQYRIGDFVNKPFHVKAEYATSKISGVWIDPAFISYHFHGTYYGSQAHRYWDVKVYKHVSKKLLEAYATAKNGYEAGLGIAIDAGPYIYVRYRHKHFSWGNGVSYLVQYQNDNAIYPPNNGMLMYEVVGFTFNKRYTVRADFGVTNPKLKSSGTEMPAYRDDPSKPNSKMRSDPDYILVEKCPASEFQPSLDAVDKLLDTLKIR